MGSNLYLGAGETIRMRLPELVAFVHGRPAWPGAAERLGPASPSGYLKYVADLVEHIAEAVENDEPVLFTSHVAWLASLAVHYAVPMDELNGILDRLLKAVRSTLVGLPADLAARCVLEGVQQLSLPVVVPDSHIDDAAPLGRLARQYLNACCAQNRFAAAELITSAISAGTSIEDIYLGVLQPVQQEIGRLYQLNRLSVGQEHFTTAATRALMSYLSGRFVRPPEHAPTAVAACIAGELHELGVRMIADFLEMNGWDAVYLGGNMPLEDLVRIAVQQHAVLLALSTTMIPNLHLVREAIAILRYSSETAGIPVLVGGPAFNLVPALANNVGANAYASDARDAVSVARKLLD